MVIAGTTSYNGIWVIETVATNTFVIDQTFVADDATGTWRTLSQGTFRRPEATDAIKTQSTVMAHTIANDPIDDNHDYRWTVEDIQDKETNTWSWDGYLIPALGHSEGTASGWIYKVSNAQNWPTLTLTRYLNAIWMQAMYGAFVDKIVFKMAGGSQPMVHAEGRAFGYAFTGRSTLDAAISADDMVLVQPADYYKYDENSVIMVDADDGANDLGYRVNKDHKTGSITAVADGGGGTIQITSAAHGLENGDVVKVTECADAAYNITAEISGVTTDTFKYTAVWTATDTGTWHSAMEVVAADDDSAASITESDDDAVYPFTPTPTFTGSPISGVQGAFEIASVTALPLQTVEITLENSFDAFEDEISSQQISDFVPGMVKVTCALGFRIRQDRIHHLANPKAFLTKDLFFRAGPDTSGKRFKFDIDYGQALFPDISIPKDGVGTATLTYSGYGSGTNGPLIITAD
ncbi:MAG: hypothetical protein ACYSWU_24035 [Planctomycetota bacterium]